MWHESTEHQINFFVSGVLRLRPQNSQGACIKGRTVYSTAPPGFPRLFSCEGLVLPESMGTFQKRFVISEVPSIPSTTSFHEFLLLIKVILIKAFNQDLGTME